MSTEIKVWNILEILKWSESFLKEKGFKNARSDAEQLLMAVLDCERIDLYMKFDKPLEKNERELYREYILRRAKYEPVQYITGFTYFMGQKFIVDPSVLIPRVDTEILVETVIANIRNKHNAENLTVIDIGTGSGAIAISLAKFLPQIKVLALDISQEALALAQKNSATLLVDEQIEFIHSDMLTELIHKRIEGNVIIISNPPYISQEEYFKLDREVKDYEPMRALTPGSDDTMFYRKIIDQAAFFGDKLIGVFFEIGYNQKLKIMQLLDDKYNNKSRCVQDLGGNSRVVYTLL